MGAFQRILDRLQQEDDRTLGVGALIGPTAVGKTSLSIDLAEALSAEIVSADSRQIYREITIGTAKPTPDQLSRIRHHFVNERSIEELMTAAEFADEARRRISEILERGKHALIVGGSTLYIHALIFGLDDVPPSDPGIRAVLESRIKTEGLPVLVEELKKVDPTAAGSIDINNPRRVLRALEVYHATGKPISAFRKSGVPRTSHTAPGSAPASRSYAAAGPRTFVLDRPREVLYIRINARVDAMYEAGFEDEVRSILEGGHPPTLQALQTIGYRETIQHLQGEIGRPEMIELVKRNTRRYAKRQLTWFRRYEDVEWIYLDD